MTRLDHDANIRPWVRAAETAGATVRWAPFDPATGELAVESVTELLGERTRVVALTGASNILGTRPDVRADRRRRARARRPRLRRRRAPDPARPGRHVGGSARTSSSARPTSSWARTSACSRPTRRCSRRSSPTSCCPPTDDVPERFELGTLPYELLAGTTAAIDFLADLVPGDGDRRARLVASMDRARGLRGGAVRPAARRAGRRRRRHAARPRGPPHPDGAVQRGRAHTAGGVRAAALWPG